MAPSPLPIKKQVSLRWGAETITLDVAQDLFSSHQVDRGSRMLLASLDQLDVPNQGTAVDFGCGYGVLGIAWQAAHPTWRTHYVDRDALAVAFAEHNVEAAGPDLMENASFLHTVTPPTPPEGGFDLVLWNVPGKAGREVVQELANIVIDGLGPGGLLALVVVHPLADVMREAAARQDVLCERDDAGKEHTVLHLRKSGPVSSWNDAFTRGVFDRPEAIFTLGEVHWSLKPVAGLPEYDSLSHSTVLAGEQMQTLAPGASPERWLVWEPGAGHLALLAGMFWPDAAGVVVSRDALALRSTRRAFRDHRARHELDVRGGWSLAASTAGMANVEMAVIAVPDQAQIDGIVQDIMAVEGIMLDGGTAIFHGGASELARVDRILARRPGWRAGRRKKNRGSSALSATRVGDT